MRNNVEPIERRTLKKVRRSFIHKTPEQEQNLVIPIPPVINPTLPNLIDPQFGLVEKNRKLYFGIYYVQSNFDITNVNIEDNLYKKIVTVNLQQKELDNANVLENGIKRLESYGDLNLATYGWKLRNRYATYPAAIQKFFELMQSPDPIIAANMRKAKNRAALRAKDIERKYTYKKVVSFLDKRASKILSVSYSQGLIELIGYNIEEFAESVKITGIPCIFKGDSSLYVDIVKTKLENSVFGEEMFCERPEFIVRINDKNGLKKEVITQNMIILEPVSEGIFVSIYLIVKEIDPKNTACESRGGNLKMLKPDNKDRDDREIEIINALFHEDKGKDIKKEES